MNATLNASDIHTLKSLRLLPQELASNLRAALFQAFKTSFGIPLDHKIKVEVDGAGTPQYGVIVRKKNGQVYPLDPATGKWVDPSTQVQPAQAPRPEAKRWFVVNRVTAMDDIVGDYDFSDGCDTGALPYNVTVDSTGTVAVDQDGDIWLLMPESAF